MRFRRRRRLGTAAIPAAALVAIVGLVGTAFLRRDASLPPAGSDAAAALPDRHRWHV